MPGYRVVHIHSDPKFIDDATAAFRGERFDNVVVVIGERGAYRGVHAEAALYAAPTPRGVAGVVDECRSADLVVLYDLDLVKSVIADRLPAGLPIAWRFFGYELYGRIRPLVLSELSNRQRPARGFVPAGYVHKLRTALKWRTTPGRAFRVAVRRIDYFLGLAEVEYSFLRQHLPDLPEFIQLPLDHLAAGGDAAQLPGEGERRCVIVGNSRNIYNNHLDVLEAISSARNRDRFTWHVWFNYGAENSYSRAVRERARGIERLTLSEDFLPIDEFRRVYRSAAAFVMNSYRQMAMANIFEALRNGLKVYLNRRNVMFDWFRREGFIIAPVDELARDIENDDLALDRAAMEHNLPRLDALGERYGTGEFQDEIARRLRAAKAAAR